MTFRIAAVVFVSMAAGLAPAQEATLSADEIIQKHITAMGGAGKLKAIQSSRATGKAVMGGGQMEASVTMWQKRPNRMRMEMNIQSRPLVTAFDGEIAWMINPFQGSTEPQKLGEDETRSAMDQADLDGALVDYQAKGHTIEVQGKEDVEGSPAWKLKVTRKNGLSDIQYIDAQTWLITKIVARRKQMGQELEIEAFPGNYKPVNGVLLPHAIEQKMSGRTMFQMTFEKFEPNLTIDDSLFRMPVPEAKRKSRKNRRIVKCFAVFERRCYASRPRRRPRSGSTRRCSAPSKPARSARRR